MLKNTLSKEIKDNECMVSRGFVSTYFYVWKLHYGRRRDKKYSLFKEITKFKIHNTMEVYLKDFISKPLITKDKTEAFLYKIGISSKKSLKTSEPIDIVTMLILDYDNESSDIQLLKKFYKKFKDYRFYLYTTFSSNIVRPRFRVIVPVKNIIYSSYLKDSNYIDYLVSVFKIDKEEPDRCCFYPYQCQLSPVTKSMSIYKYVVNKGKRIELKEYKEVVRNIDDETEEYTDGYVIEDINSIAEKNELIHFFDFRIDKEKRKQQLEKLKKIKDKNYRNTKEYREGLELENKEKSSCRKSFKNKMEFIRYWIPKAVQAKKIEVFSKAWQDYYGFDIKDSSKWEYKFNKFLEKVLDNKGMEIKDIQ